MNQLLLALRLLIKLRECRRQLEHCSSRPGMLLSIIAFSRGQRSIKENPEDDTPPPPYSLVDPVQGRPQAPQLPVRSPTALAVDQIAHQDPLPISPSSTTHVDHQLPPAPQESRQLIPEATCSLSLDTHTSDTPSSYASSSEDISAFSPHPSTPGSEPRSEQKAINHTEFYERNSEISGPLLRNCVLCLYSPHIFSRDVSRGPPA